MKQLLSISFLILYINSFTEFHEVLRLPILFEHYAEHKKLTNDLSFLDFLELHYKTDVNHDDRDRELPFKMPGHSFTAHAATIPTQKLAAIDLSQFSVVAHSFLYKESAFTSPAVTIFQPPRIG